MPPTPTTSSVPSPPVPHGAVRARRPARAAAWTALAALAGTALPAPGAAQDPVRYTISFENRAHHEASVEVVLPDLPGGPLELRMARSSPGRYALHEFAKNVYGFEAWDGAGEALAVTRPDPHRWRVAGHDGTVRVRYTLFADRGDGTYSQVDESHAHLNIPATFMYAPDLPGRPVRVTFRIPSGSGWRVATQLAPTGDPETWTAPDQAYFMDSPTEVSDHALRSWTVESGGRTQTIRVAMHHLGTDAELDAYVEHARAIVREEMEVFGALPEFDFGTYTFLACYLPWASGDGMEHRNSTILTSTVGLDRGMIGRLGTVAHEFFHAWNVERMRPATLEPFDFSRENMSRELWFAEGFTSYYDDLAMVRGRVIDVETFAQRLGGSISSVVNAPGRRFFGPAEMSMRAPFVDAATSVDPVNTTNTFLSYYTWGSVVAAGLDLTLRTRFDGLTLDRYMRAAWERFGETETPYDVEDLEATLAHLTGDERFARTFFDRYVRGREVPDFEALLPRAGLALRPARPGAAVLAFRALSVSDEGGLQLTGPALHGGPLYRAGLDRGDRIVSVDGRAFRDVAALEDWLAGRAPGDRVEVSWVSRGRNRSAAVELAADPALEVVTAEAAGAGPSDAARRLREAWLGSGP